ncbi:MAG: hypothetical protein JST04_03260 [Bdellovibrionales bacterium]|nr:hypothetical protein [Bdellovibrionales bacterium]
MKKLVAILPALVLGTALMTASAHEEDARVELVGHTITIISDIVIYGPGATRAVADKIQTDVMNAWSKQSDGRAWTYFDRASNETYVVQFDVRASLYDGKERTSPGVIWDAWNPNSRKNYIKIVDTEFRSNVIGGDEGTWKSDCDCFAHEFGHLIGFKDRYHQDENGKDVSNAGWEENIMDDSWDHVEQRNIDVLASRVLKNRKIRRSTFWPTQNEAGVFHDEIDIMNPAD